MLAAQKNGGAEGIRTPDPHNAIVVLYQPFVKRSFAIFPKTSEKVAGRPVSLHPVSTGSFEKAPFARPRPPS